MKQQPESLWLLDTGARDNEGSWARQRATRGLPRAIPGQVNLGDTLGAPGTRPEDRRLCGAGGAAARGAERRGPSLGCAEPGGASAS